MKKTILAFLLGTTVLIGGCSMADVEKAPITVPSTTEKDSDPLPTLASDTDTNSSLTKEAVTKALEELSPTPMPEETDLLIVEVEGMTEQITGHIFQSTLGYHMTYDPERFTVTNENGIDSYMAANSNPDLYPYVYLNISRYDIPTEGEALDNTSSKPNWHKVTKGSVTGYIRADIAEEESYDIVSIGEKEAFHHTMKEGTEWNSVVRDYYVLTTSDSIYLLEVQNFLEAQEGFGARILSMLKTFVLN